MREAFRRWWRRNFGGARLHDWQLDIDDDGGQTGRCPVCHSHYVSFRGYNVTAGECWDCEFKYPNVRS